MKFEIGEVAILVSSGNTKGATAGKEVECEIVSGPHTGFDQHNRRGYADEEWYAIYVHGDTSYAADGCWGALATYLRKKKPPHKDIEETRKEGIQSWDKMMNKLKQPELMN